MPSSSSRRGSGSSVRCVFTDISFCLFFPPSPFPSFVCSGVYYTAFCFCICRCISPVASWACGHLVGAVGGAESLPSGFSSVATVQPSVPALLCHSKQPLVPTTTLTVDPLLRGKPVTGVVVYFYKLQSLLLPSHVPRATGGFFTFVQHFPIYSRTGRA